MRTPNFGKEHPQTNQTNQKMIQIQENQTNQTQVSVPPKALPRLGTSGNRNAPAWCCAGYGASLCKS